MQVMAPPSVRGPAGSCKRNVPLHFDFVQNVRQLRSYGAPHVDTTAVNLVKGGELNHHGRSDRL